MSRGFWIVLLVAATATLLFMTALRSFTPVGRQQYNMAVAERELPRVRTLLEADNRFKGVSAYVYTGQDGAVGLVGWVEKDEDLFRLIKAVATEQFPVAIAWQVKVAAGNER